MAEESPAGLKSDLVPNKSKFRRPKNRYKLINFLFIVPALILNLVFFIYPLINAFIMSFYKVPVLGDWTFIGLSNYIRLFDDPLFFSSLFFTLKYILLITIPLF